MKNGILRMFRYSLLVVINSRRPFSPGKRWRMCPQLGAFAKTKYGQSLQDWAFT